VGGGANLPKFSQSEIADGLGVARVIRAGDSGVS